MIWKTKLCFNRTGALCVKRRIVKLACVFLESCVQERLEQLCMLVLAALLLGVHACDLPCFSVAMPPKWTLEGCCTCLLGS
jgi:hypothetical protein